MYILTGTYTLPKGNLLSRLDAVEQQFPGPKAVLLWVMEGVKTREQALAEQYPDGVTPGAPVYILEWKMGDSEAQSSIPS